MNLKALIEHKNTLLEERDAIMEAIESEVRMLNTTEQARLNELAKEVRGIDKEIATRDDEFQASKKCTLVMPGESLQTRSVASKDHNVTLEKVLKGVMLGKYDDNETRQYVQRSLNSTTGKVTIPQRLADQILDMARNKSVFLSSLPLAPMDNNNLTIAKLVKDIEFSFVAEGDKIPFSDAAFEGAEFVGKALCGITNITDALLDSAQDLENTLIMAMGSAIGSALDKAILYGDDVNGIKGIITYTGINTVTVPAHDYNSIIKGVRAVKGANFEPTHVVMSTNTGSDLAMLQDAQGQYISIPKAIEDLVIGESNNVLDTDIIVYDPMQILVGIHKSMDIQIGFSSSTFDFESLKKSIRCYVRCDAKPLNEKAIALVRVAQK